MASMLCRGLLIFLVSSVTFLASGGLADCPEACTCKWKGGKQTVECINASLTSIPAKIEAGTQVLDLGLNYLPSLATDTFTKHNLTNLQKIFLEKCSVQVLEVHTFRGLTNLVELDLSGNALTSAPTSAVEDCKYLMRLSLRSNPIGSIGEEAFRGLHELVSLDLSGCGLEKVHPYAFRGLDSLEYLRLEANRLTTLSSAQSFPPNLRDLTLYGNRWHCDCHLLSLHNWIQNFTVPDAVEPRCATPTPRLLDRKIKALAKEDFACVPNVSPTSMYLEVIEGKNMSLVCSIQAFPDAVVTWRYKESPIVNNSKYSYVNSGFGEQRKSELFLSPTSIDDNGTFTCIAVNKAGIAIAEFTLHVVVPVPPKPPQDVVEERFRTEYVVAIVVILLLVVAPLTLTTFLAKRCQRNKSRAKRLRSSSDAAKHYNNVNHQQEDSMMTIHTNHQDASLSPDLLNHLSSEDKREVNRSNEHLLVMNGRCIKDVPPAVPKRSTSFDLPVPPIAFADSTEEEFMPHLMRHLKSAPAPEVAMIPPPPQYKGVHFAPQVQDDEESEEIPVEGLPTKPAKPLGETIAIKVQNQVPILASLKTVTPQPSSFSTLPAKSWGVTRSDKGVTSSIVCLTR